MARAKKSAAGNRNVQSGSNRSGSARRKAKRTIQVSPRRAGGSGKPRLSNAMKPKGKILDARQKILSTKRKLVADARDVLSRKTKVQDARNKILRLRETNTGTNASVRAIGTSILRKTDRNGKITLLTSKNKQSTSDINVAIQQQLGLIQSPPRRKPLVTKRAAAVRKPPSPEPLLRQTIVKEIQPQYSYDNYFARYEPFYDIPTMGLASRSALVDAREYWRSAIPRYAVPPQRIAEYVDLDMPQDEDMPLIVAPAKHNIIRQSPSNVHSRLDTAPAQSQSHGIFASTTKTKVVVPAGHRIVVSNLQPSVTQDDIRELFEDIGQLLVARLVRPGTAEVIYKNLKDAQGAVDTYHNRQLDGQPMKCLLVNKRPLNNPTGPAIKADLASAVLKRPPTATRGFEKLVPDLQTIHKVLFKRN